VGAVLEEAPVVEVMGVPGVVEVTEVSAVLGVGAVLEEAPVVEVMGVPGVVEVTEVPAVLGAAPEVDWEAELGPVVVGLRLEAPGFPVQRRFLTESKKYLLPKGAVRSGWASRLWPRSRTC